jgi:hypothetical protein
MATRWTPRVSHSGVEAPAALMSATALPARRRVEPPATSATRSVGAAWALTMAGRCSAWWTQVTWVKCFARSLRRAASASSTFMALSNSSRTKCRTPAGPWPGRTCRKAPQGLCPDRLRGKKPPWLGVVTASFTAAASVAGRGKESRYMPQEAGPPPGARPAWKETEGSGTAG